MLRGSLSAHSDFIGTSSVPTVDAAATGVVVLTGDNVFHTADGDFFTKDALVLNTTGDGELTEIDTIVGGTGRYAGATMGFYRRMGFEVESRSELDPSTCSNAGASPPSPREARRSGTATPSSSSRD